MSPGNKEVHTVRLDRNSPEYKEVSDRFYATAQNVSITSIERIQNPLLYRTYVLKKESMDKVNGGNTERRLLHGTSSESITPINKQGFNRSLCGKNGEYNFTGFWIGWGLLCSKQRRGFTDGLTMRDLAQNIFHHKLSVSLSTE